MTISELQESLNLAHSGGLSWRKIASNYGVNVYYVYSLAHGKEPKSPNVRRVFGLPPICSTCKRRVPRPHPIPPAWVMEAADWLEQKRAGKNGKGTAS